MRRSQSRRGSFVPSECPWFPFPFLVNNLHSKHSPKHNLRHGSVRSPALAFKCCNLKSAFRCITMWEFQDLPSSWDSNVIYSIFLNTWGTSKGTFRAKISASRAATILPDPERRWQPLCHGIGFWGSGTNSSGPETEEQQMSHLTFHTVLREDFTIAHWGLPPPFYKYGKLKLNPSCSAVWLCSQWWI